MRAFLFGKLSVVCVSALTVGVLGPFFGTLTRPAHDLQGAASTPLARIPLPPVALSGNPLRTHTCGSRSARVSTRGGAKPSSQTILFPFDFHPPHHFEMNSSPIYFFLDVMPQQARTSRLPTWVWGISERFSTGQRSPTRPLTVYAPKPQVSSLVHATGKGATGSARGWACAVENRSEIPQAHVSARQRRHAS